MNLCVIYTYSIWTTFCSTFLAVLLDVPACPYCRQKMNLILPYFTDEEHQSEASEAKTQVLQNVMQYNRVYSGQPRSIVEHITDLPMLFRRFIRYLATYEGLTFVMSVRIVPFILMTTIYALSPLDIVPEAALGIIGLLDDVVILMMCLFYVITLYRNFAAENLEF